MPTYLYPEARELREFGPNLMSEMMADDLLFQRFFPIVESDSPLLQWSVDDDDDGLQQLRGIDGSPQSVNKTGATSYVARPGYYGEFETITETELTERAGSLIGNATVSVEDLVAAGYRNLIHREVNRIRMIGWSLLINGTYSVSAKGGTVTHTDTFDVRTQAGTDWSNPATSTPLADLRAIQEAGSANGVDYGTGAVAAMNLITANQMLKNANSADLGGRRTLGGGTVNSLAETNRILLGEGLPEIRIYDKGYNSGGAFTKFIATGKVGIMGTREDGSPIAEYRMTRNLNNPGAAPGSYEYIKDYAQGVNAPKETPPRIEVHRGHNGGPIIFRPKAVTVLTVAA